MEAILVWLNSYILSPIVPTLLVASGLIYGVRTGFMHIFRIPTIVRSMLENGERGSSHSPIRAMTVALAGTLGVGNITGVATAIVCGGAGAIFWMWVGAIISMPVKYAEVVLAVKHRVTKKSGEHVGGAMYYMKSRVLTLPFSLLCILASLTLGNLMQIAAVAETAESVFHIPALALAIPISIFIFFAVSRGIKAISNVTSFLVPLMSLLYVLLSLAVIVPNISRLPGIIAWIVSDAFKPSAAIGGIGGFLLMRSLRYGISRGIVSNESGCGTAPIAHAGADTDSPARQGFWGIFEVFADTIVMCSLTAFVILLSVDKFPHLDSMELVIACFGEYLGSVSGYLLAVCVFFFALATIIGWSYYGMVSLDFLTKSKKMHTLYIFVYCAMIVVGAKIGNSLMWQLTDLTVGIMTVINSTFLLTRVSQVGAETDLFFKTHKKRRSLS